MSRIEKILKAIIDETDYDEEPQSRIEKQLISILKNEPYEDDFQSRIEVLIELVREHFSSSLDAEEILKSLITRQITEIIVPSDITSIGSSAFQNCRSLQNVTLSHGIERINVSAFTNCVSLTYLYLPNTINYVANTNPFNSCSELTVVSLENGFNANGLNLSASTNFSAETLVAILNALADRTGLEAYTLTLGSANLEKLSNEQIAIASEKNWTLA